MFTNYLKTAYRHLLRNKLHSFINLTGLSVGVACAVVISVFVDYESTFDTFHRKSDRTFRVVQHTKLPDEMLYWGATCFPLAEALRNDFPDFANVSQVAGPYNRTIAVERSSNDVHRFDEKAVLFADTAFANVFDLEWIAGSKTTALALKHSVVLTQSAADRCFSRAIDYSALLGKVILLDGKDALTVTGIIRDAPGNTTVRYSMIVPYQFYKENNQYRSGNWSGNYGGRTFIVLEDPGAEKSVEEKINKWKGKYLKPDDDAKISYFLQPLTEIHNQRTYGNSSGSYTMQESLLQSATIIGLIILIIAAVNFVNLTTAMATTRSKEIGVRKVLGTSRGRLMGQFLCENSILVLITLAISVGLSQVALQRLNSYLVIINLDLAFQWKHIFSILGIGLLVIVLAAVYPAIVMSSFKPIEAVKNKITFDRLRTFSLRRFLIVTQFTVVQLLVIATIIVAVQVRYLKNADLGFEKSSVLHTGVPVDGQQDAFRNVLLGTTGISDVTFGSSAPLPVDAQYGTNYRLPQQPETEGKKADMKVIDVNYIPFFGLKLIAGKNISSVKDKFDEFVVNETLVRSMGWSAEQAVGEKLIINEGEGTIVGVVEDFNNVTLHDQIIPTVMMNWTAILLRAYIKYELTPGEAIQTIESKWKSFAPDGIFRYGILSQSIEQEYAMEEFIFYAFSMFSALAIAIGCLGLFGLSSFMAVRRSKEIGVRKVLGASMMSILSNFSTEFVWMVIIGYMIAAPSCYILMSKWLQGFEYQIHITWWMLAAGGVTGLFVALATVSFHAIRVGQANPVESLRSE